MKRAIWPAFATALLLMQGTAFGATLRVCASPNNLPYSNKAGAGYENKLAQFVAAQLHEKLAYFWTEGRGDYLEKTLLKGKCDVAMGVPVDMPEIATTRPYFSSSFVFVYRTGSEPGLSSIRDVRLRRLKIGVHLLGDNDTPPAVALSEEGIVDNVKGFMILGDISRPNPPARVIDAVADGDIDVAAVWGPLGGYFARHSKVPLTVVPIADTEGFAPLVFRYAIAMGTRPGDVALRNRLDGLIAAHRTQIRNILMRYGIPFVARNGG